MASIYIKNNLNVGVKGGGGGLFNQSSDLQFAKVPTFFYLRIVKLTLNSEGTYR